MFNQNDIRQIEGRGMTLPDIERQIQWFKEGIPPIHLVRPAVIGDGIEVVKQEDEEELILCFDNDKTGYKPLKFIPASGAASRMFKSLFEARAFLKEHPESSETYLSENPAIAKFFNDLPMYPFYADLKGIATDWNLDLMIRERKYHEILNLLLGEDGLNYGGLPKGLLKFHNYGDLSRTAFEEHFAETMDYLADEEEEVHLHFTVSAENRLQFEELANELSGLYAENRGTRYIVEFSEQMEDTDSIAVDLNDEVFRDPEGNLVFRPGGHGALLGNLAGLDSSVVFIGNIDNIAPEKARQFKVKYKKILGGFLLERVRIIHALLDNLEKGASDDVTREKVIGFIREISFDEAESLEKETVDVFNSRAFKFLDRPVRVCGMVENVGEPGGGPFWVSDNNGMISRQIVERSQVDLEDPEQNRILEMSTHFNPVDMVCFIKDYRGKPFDLFSFRDPALGFISNKSINGQDIKALELPGLWNGSMAGWITYFLDIPLATFTPVKTIFDLLRPEHSQTN